MKFFVTRIASDPIDASQVEVTAANSEAAAYGGAAKFFPRTKSFKMTEIVSNYPTDGQYDVEDRRERKPLGRISVRRIVPGGNP